MDASGIHAPKKWRVKSDGVLPCDGMPAHVAGRSSAPLSCQSIHGVVSTIRALIGIV